MWHFEGTLKGRKAGRMRQSSAKGTKLCRHMVLKTRLLQVTYQLGISETLNLNYYKIPLCDFHSLIAWKEPMHINYILESKFEIKTWGQGACNLNITVTDSFPIIIKKDSKWCMCIYTHILGSLSSNLGKICTHLTLLLSVYNSNLTPGSISSFCC